VTILLAIIPSYAILGYDMLGHPDTSDASGVAVGSRWWWGNWGGGKVKLLLESRQMKELVIKYNKQCC